LAYVNDMVLIAENKEERISMMVRLERYLEKKKLETGIENKDNEIRKGSERMGKKD